MAVDDIPKVFHMGEELFSASRLPLLYRTWDPYEIAYLFSSETDLSLVAEVDGEVVGFCLSTTIEKPGKPWRYGYLIWLGVTGSFQRSGVGKRLVRETTRRMKAQRVGFMLIDTEEDNERAIRFFERLGFRLQAKQRWMWKNLGRGAPSYKTIKESISTVRLRKRPRR